MDDPADLDITIRSGAEVSVTTTSTPCATHLRHGGSQVEGPPAIASPTPPLRRPRGRPPKYPVAHGARVSADSHRRGRGGARGGARARPRRDKTPDRIPDQRRSPESSPASRVSSALSTPEHRRVQRVDLEEQPIVGIDEGPRSDIVPPVPRVDQFWQSLRTSQPVARTKSPLGYRSRLAEMKPLDLGRCDVICTHCAARHWIDERATPSTRKNPVFRQCCGGGKIELPPVPEPPELLRRLLDGSEPRSSDFRTKVRSYNAAFAFTCFKYGEDQRLHGRTGIHAFQIHGEVYHLMGPIGQAAAGVRPRFAQLYFYDPEQSSEYRSLHQGLDPILTRELGAVIEEHNPFVQRFVSAHDTINQNDGEADLILNPQLQIVIQPGSDKRRFNLPVTGEVAAILPDEWSDPSFRDVLLYHRNEDGTVSDRRTKIARTHPAYLPLHYVLLFPFGTPGWHWNMTCRGDRAAGPDHSEPSVTEGLLRDLEHGHNRDDSDDGEAQDGGQRSGRRLTQRPWYRYYLFERNHEFPTILRAGRLFEQFVDDAWASVDHEMLDWHRYNQDAVRAELYTGLMDAMAGDFEASHIGQPVILAASYLHGDRFMSKCYQNSIAIMRQFGSPSFFITFTANPRWREVQELSWDGMSGQQRHDVIVRVYKLKLDAMLREIKGITVQGTRLKSGGVFGDCIGDVYTIEYQKRGLPHAHILVFMRDNDRPLTPESVDESVCAELPLPAEDPDGELFDIVTSCLVHGPCGGTYPDERCMEQVEPGKPKQCVKRFPKAFRDRTCIREDGYPSYRRREGGRTFVKKIKGQDVELDCRWVVPYNPYLTKRYKAHINVEVCGSVQAIKYIHKYIYKGADRATIRIQDRYDEIAATLNGRYITPAMAIWNIMAFRCHEEKPPVTQLSYHLEGRHIVHFAAGMSIPQLAVAAEQQTSMFIAWMEYNRTHDEGNLDLRYQDFPVTYRWDKRGRQWKRRKGNTPAIGRLYAANPNQGEYFELWRLLQRSRGAKSYQDLYTVNGVTYAKPSEACGALGLNFGDAEWQLFFEETRHASTGHNMRTLFVIACVQGSIRNGRELWKISKMP